MYDWRKKIDELDRKLVELLNQRAQAAHEIGKLKRGAGMVRRPRGEEIVSAGGPVVSARPSVIPTSAAGERADPCTMVIFGALGDLCRRKLLPAIYQLMKEHLVHEKFAVLGIGRDDAETDEKFREHMRKALDDSDEVKGVDNELWEALSKRLDRRTCILQRTHGFCNQDICYHQR